MCYAVSLKLHMVADARALKPYIVHQYTVNGILVGQIDCCGNPLYVLNHNSIIFE